MKNGKGRKMRAEDRKKFRGGDPVKGKTLSNHWFKVSKVWPAESRDDRQWCTGNHVKCEGRVLYGSLLGSSN